MVSYRLYGNLPVNGIKAAFNAICKTISSKLKLSENIVFDVNIVDAKTIKSINKKFRKIDKVTDVISFANRDNNNITVPLIGEIFICLSQAKKQAKDYQHSVQRELIFLFTHGLLHLLGYDHQNKKDEKIMFNLSDEIINQAQINPKYIIK